MKKKNITLKNISNIRGRIVEYTISLETYLSTKIAAYYEIAEDKESHFLFNVLYNKYVPNIALVKMFFGVLKQKKQYNSFPTKELLRLGEIRNIFAHSSLREDPQEPYKCKFTKTIDEFTDCDALFDEYETKFKKVVNAMMNLGRS